MITNKMLTYLLWKSKQTALCKAPTKYAETLRILCKYKRVC